MKKVTSNLQEFFEKIYKEIQEFSDKKLNKSRRRFICQYCIGLIQSRSVHSSNIASYMATDAKIDSDIRKIERFYADFKLDDEFISFVLVFCLPKGKVNISMDRTDWKFGNKWRNILAVTVNSGKVGIPIWIEVLNKKRGTSNANERIDIMDKVLKVLGLERIIALYADREFIGQKWIDYLLEHGIHFFIRLRNNQQILYDGLTKSIEQILGNKTNLLLDNVFIYNTWLSLAIKAVKNNKDKDIIAVLTNTRANNAIKKYKKRWTIEVLFQSLKKRGFDLETTHLKKNDRVRKLFMLSSLAFALTYAVGSYVHYSIKKIPTKNHGYFSVSIFRKGLDTFREHFKLNISMCKIFKVLFKLTKIRIKTFLAYSNFVG